MKIYLAGNFPQSASVKKEKKVMKRALSNSSYSRLVSFYYTVEMGWDGGWANNTIEAARRVKKK